MLKGVKHTLLTVHLKDMCTTAEIKRVLHWVSSTFLLCLLLSRTYVSCAGYNHAHMIPICPSSHWSPHLPSCCPPQLRPPRPCLSQCGRLSTSSCSTAFIDAVEPMDINDRISPISEPGDLPMDHATATCTIHLAHSEKIMIMEDDVPNCYDMSFSILSSFHIMCSIT